MIGYMNRGFSDLKNTMISGFNRLGEGQDKTLEQIKYMHLDMNAGFSGLKEEVHKQRDDLKEMFLKEVF